MRKLSSGLLLSAVLAMSPFEAGAQNAPTARPAIDGILAAFETHPLVGLADNHGLAQELDFYVSLIRDQRFAHDVGNVVVEFGGAAHQDIVDRYVNGEAVPYTELRKVWTDVIGWNPTVTILGYLNFYAQVRAANLTLPPEQRIHVWLGEPEIDWSKIRSSADITPGMQSRDQHPAEVIERDILARNKKALVIYGTQHFSDTPFPGVPQALGGGGTLRTLIARKYPNAFFIVTPYYGFVDKPCSAALEQRFRDWPTPALAPLIRGGVLEEEMRKPGCVTQPLTAWNIGGPNITDAMRTEFRSHAQKVDAGLTGDALLFLGPASTLTRSPNAPDIYLDADYRQEINRRVQVTGGQPLSPITSQTNPVTPRYVRP